MKNKRPFYSVRPAKTIVLAAIISGGGFLFSRASYATTYYVDASRPDDIGNGRAVETAKKYIESGIALMSGGDTLVIRSGTYSTANDQITSVPNGTAGRYSVIKAANDGQAVITAADGFRISARYLQIEGLKFSGPWEKTTAGDHFKILRCAFQGGPATGNTVNFAVGDSYILLEDCWFYGTGGRYKILMYQADHVVVRRCVIRDDAGWSDTKGDPEAGIAVYESAAISLQNVIVIDQNLTTYAGSYVGAFYLTGHSGNPASNNVEYLGCISINNKGENWHVDTDDGGVGLILRDVIGYGGEDGIGTSNTSMDMTVQRATIGNVSGSAIGNWGKKAIAVADAILWDAGQSYKGSVSATYTNTYNPNDFSGAGITHANPLTSGLLYLPRIETGSALKTSGQGSGQKGAQIIKKIGISGTLYGDAGWNTVTGDNLWPWTNESRIKADMASVSDRGFASSGNGLYGGPISLTSYLWEYLGNPCPQGICYDTLPVHNIASLFPASTGILGVTAKKISGKEIIFEVNVPQSGEYRLRVCDILGRSMWDISEEVSPGIFSVFWTPVSEISNGSYFVMLSQKGNRIKWKFVVAQ